MFYNALKMFKGDVGTTNLLIEELPPILAVFQNKVVKCHSHEFFPRVTHMFDLRANLVINLIQSLIRCKQNALYLVCLDSKMRFKE